MCIGVLDFLSGRSKEIRLNINKKCFILKLSLMKGMFYFVLM